MKYERQSRTAVGHTQTVQYIVVIFVQYSKLLKATASNETVAHFHIIRQVNNPKSCHYLNDSGGSPLPLFHSTETDQNQDIWVCKSGDVFI